MEVEIIRVVAVLVETFPLGAAAAVNLFTFPLSTRSFQLDASLVGI